LNLLHGCWVCYFSFGKKNAGKGSQKFATSKKKKTSHSTNTKNDLSAHTKLAMYGLSLYASAGPSAVGSTNESMIILHFFKQV